MLVQQTSGSLTIICNNDPEHGIRYIPGEITSRQKTMSADTPFELLMKIGSSKLHVKCALGEVNPEFLIEQIRAKVPKKSKTVNHPPPESGSGVLSFPARQ